MCLPLSWREAHRVCIVEALQKAHQAYFHPIVTRVADEELEARAHETKYVAHANALETCNQGTPYLACVATLETGVGEAMDRTCTNKRESYTPTMKLDTCAFQRATRSSGKEPKACA